MRIVGTAWSNCPTPKTNPSSLPLERQSDAPSEGEALVVQVEAGGANIEGDVRGDVALDEEVGAPAVRELMVDGEAEEEPHIGVDARIAVSPSAHGGGLARDKDALSLAGGPIVKAD